MLSPEGRRNRLLNAKQDEPAVRVLQAVLQRSHRKRAKMLASALCAVRKNVLPKEPLISALILKPVGNCCNLRCAYCFNRPEQHCGSVLMSSRVLERAVVSGLAAGVEHFVWHGGEPLLAGLDFFQQAIAMQEKHNHSGRAVRNSVQSNGIALNEEWLNFFQQHQFRISISLDGPSHDRHRRHASGQGSLQQVLDSIHLLQDQQISFGVLAVITRNMSVSPKDFFTFFVDQSIEGFQISPCAWPPELAVSPEEYADFGLCLFATWLKSGLPQMQVGPLEQIAATFLGQPPSLCWMAGNCSQFVGIEPDGSVWPCCDRVLPSQKYCWGNVLKEHLADILKNNKAEQFRTTELRSQEQHCLSCQWHFVCKGGCVHHRILHGGATDAPDPFCDGYKKIFVDLAAQLDEILW